MRMLAVSCTIFRRSSLPFFLSSASSVGAESKWSSMARLPWPLTMRISSMPLASASSTMYWMVGLSTIGSISFGVAFVAGRKRVP